ncbi:MAG TPA: hypothetical protein GX745_02470 [Clostridiales bacterium]|jgi:stage III sporulation protein AG|nr:hypothetical protein [Clostridiales bacterium]
MDKKIIKQVYVSSYQKNDSQIPNNNSAPFKSNNLDRPKQDIASLPNEKIQQSQNDIKQSNSAQILLTDSSFSSTQDKTKTNKKPSKILDKIVQKIKSIKNFEIYIALIFVIIVLFIYFGSNFSCSSDKKAKDEETYQSAYDYCQHVEKKLSKILSSIKNAGRVDVMITFESTPERVIAYITSSSSNISSGGNGVYNENTSNTSSPQVIYVKGDQIPLILKEVSPKVIGVVIVAEGGDDIKVKLDIINAVSVLLDLNADQIKVLTMNKE